MLKVPRGLKTQKKLQRSHADPKTQFIFIISKLKTVSRGNVIRHGPTKLSYIYLYICFMLMYAITIHMAGQSTLRDLLSNNDRMNGQTMN